MKSYTADNIINIAVTGQAGTGKTILSESILFNSNIIRTMGSIESGSTVSDYNDFESSSQHSISLSVLTFEHMDKKINMIDVPGYIDFIGELKSTIRVSDCILNVVSSTDGVMIGNDLSYEYSKENHFVPTFFVVNLCDREQSNFDSVLNSLKDSFGRSVFPFMIPMNEGEGFNKIGDVLKKEVHTYDSSGKYASSPAEGDDLNKLDSLHNELIELIAESSEELLEIFFENGELSEDELRGGLHKAILSDNLTPVFCTSGQKNVGVARAMEIIAKYSPCASDTKEFSCISGDSENMVQVGGGDTMAFVFKTSVEEHVGEISFFRVYNGSVDVGTDIANVSTNEVEKIRQLYITTGKERSDVSSIPVGDIGAALKLKNTHTCNTLSSSKSGMEIKKINFPSDNMRYAVVPANKGDEEKLATGLSMMHQQDPTFTYNVDPELKQTIIAGQGEMHLESCLSRIKDRFGLELNLSTPKIPYRETITMNAEAKYRHKKQSGGSGQFAEVWLRIAPGTRGQGVDFKESLVGQNVDRGFVPSVEKGINAMCLDGIIAGCKVVDLNIDFYDGKMHPVDSNDMAFQIAGRHAFSDAFKAAKPKLLEPIYKVKIKVPDSFTGDVMGDISQRRGKVAGMGASGNFQEINAEVPLANLHDYATALKAMTSGTGFFSTEFSSYEDMPANEAQKVIAAYSSSEAVEEE